MPDLSPIRSNKDGRRGYGSIAEVVIHGSANPLLAAEIPFSCLHGNVPEKELDLIQFPTRCMTQLRARTPQIIGRYLGI